MSCSHRLWAWGDNSANCPECRAQALIYRALVDLQTPMILPIAQAVVAEMPPDLIKGFGGKEQALNSILLTAAEAYMGVVEAGHSDEDLAYLAHDAEDLNFNKYDIAILLSVAKSLAESSDRQG